jgi:hypothetical protein
MVDCSRDSCFFPFHVHTTGSAHSLHRFGVPHQTSLRSLLTMMSSSNSPHFGEADRLFRAPITAEQDHVLKQAFPHGHHRAFVAAVRGHRAPGNRSGHAAGSRVGFRVARSRPFETSHCMFHCTLRSRTSPDEPNQNQESATEDKQLEE